MPDKVCCEPEPLEPLLGGTSKRGQRLRQFKGDTLQGFQLLGAENAFPPRRSWVQRLSGGKAMHQSAKTLFGDRQAALVDSREGGSRVLTAKLVGVFDG